MIANNPRFVATECSLQPVVQSFKASVARGVYQETQLAEWTVMNYTLMWKEGYRVALTPNWNESYGMLEGQIFSIGYEAWGSIILFLEALFGGYIAAASDTFNFQRSTQLGLYATTDVLEAIFYNRINKTTCQSDDQLTCSLNQVAAAMSKTIRDLAFTGNASSQQQGFVVPNAITGKTNIVVSFVFVRWRRLILPVSVWVLGTLFCLCSAWSTRHAQVQTWMNSILPLALPEMGTPSGQGSDSDSTSPYYSLPCSDDSLKEYASLGFGKPWHMAKGGPAFFSDDESSKTQLVSEIREACLEFGFFQLRNHGIPRELQRQILAQSGEIFRLPTEVKMSYDKDTGGFNRGYERLRAQNFEKKTEGDLKEGFYLGRDLPLDDPYVAARKFGQGPNKYPEEVANPSLFRETVDEYHTVLSGLAKNILRVLAKTLDLPEEHFEGFCDHPVAVLRLLHYPPQAPDASDLERGIGAHTDFGAVTILLQDQIGGLQVWNRELSVWVDVEPVEDAVVVNLGNMMMRWTNDRYLSNLHRVINKSGKERYSVPFFFSGNPDYVVKCISSCEGEQGAKYPPITVNEWMNGRYADTYGLSKGKGISELLSTKIAGTV